jgi:hypothetical protein
VRVSPAEKNDVHFFGFVFKSKNSVSEIGLSKKIWGWNPIFLNALQ